MKFNGINQKNSLLIFVNKMKGKIFFIILVIVLLFLECQTQRGGGSRSRSSRSSSRSFFSSSSSKYNKKTKKDSGFSIWEILGFGIGGISAIISLFKKSDYNSKNQTKRITQGYEKRYQQNICTLDEDQRNRTIDWFMNNKWSVQFKSDSINSGSFSITVTDIVKRNDFVYEIKAAGQNDELGDSEINGILLFQGSYLSICFDKVYKDRNKAGQTGKWSVLVYEGIQQGQVFSGRWYFEGFEQNNQYSGQMRMVHA